MHTNTPTTNTLLIIIVCYQAKCQWTCIVMLERWSCHGDCGVVGGGITGCHPDSHWIPLWRPDSRLVGLPIFVSMPSLVWYPYDCLNWHMTCLIIQTLVGSPHTIWQELSHMFSNRLYRILILQTLSKSVNFPIILKLCHHLSWFKQSNHQIHPVLFCLMSYQMLCHWTYAHTTKM